MLVVRPVAEGNAAQVSVTTPTSSMARIRCPHASGWDHLALNPDRCVELQDSAGIRCHGCLSGHAALLPLSPTTGGPAMHGSLRVVLLAPDVRLVVAKVLAATGTGSGEDVTAGIKWIVDQGALDQPGSLHDLVRMSSGIRDATNSPEGRLASAENGWGDRESWLKNRTSKVGSGGRSMSTVPALSSNSTPSPPTRSATCSRRNAGNHPPTVITTLRACWLAT